MFQRIADRIAEQSGVKQLGSPGKKDGKGGAMDVSLNHFEVAVSPPGKTKTKENANNSAIRIRCEDPSTRDIVQVVIIPLINTSDEENLTKILLRLVGKYCFQLLKIMDFNIYSGNMYNSQGFQTTSEKLGIIVKEYYMSSIPLMEYINWHWDSLTNNELREIFLSCILALRELHEVSVLHQNLSPNSFIVVSHDLNKLRVAAQSTSASLAAAVHDAGSTGKGGGDAVVKKSANPTKVKTSAVSTKPSIKLDGYWFLENPRSFLNQVPGGAGGRADWGCPSTMPPEVYQSAGAVSEKSDIFAFGMCVYFWATRGKQLPFSHHSLVPQSSHAVGKLNATIVFSLSSLITL